MTPSAPRLASLDQFRGYTVLGMFFVNFVGGYAAIPAVFHHHNTYCSYADTIMPQFLLAVGFGMRLSFLRRREREGAAAAYRHFATRILGLILLGAVVYHLTGSYKTWEELTAKADSPGKFLLDTIKRGPFEALVHIAVTSLWVLPVIAAPGWARALFGVSSAGLHVWLSLKGGYFVWNLSGHPGIDGGPLGFMTWAVPLVVGTLAYDWVAEGRPLPKLLAVGAALMAIAYWLSLKSPQFSPPFVQPTEPFSTERWVLDTDYYWSMSQRAGSVTYTAFAAGFGLWVYAAFLVACDWWGLRWGYLDLLGRHALAGYVIHDLVSGAVKPFVPKDSPAAWVLTGFLVFLGVTTLFLRYLDRNKYYLRL
ncbi:MAG TPA: heparan-alpha-glucosaminide N-acetyltransferase domain-containing protein [Fimbriiglobus sp.]|nr:heparan-alpha-glucosaminide N-acetyltransferase domain-containing protein [Fimbriiglobus sp.]